MRSCDGCRFCCFSFNVSDVPDEVRGFALKDALSHCRFECQAGCALHDKEEQPAVCREFRCPYLTGKMVHKPEVFQEQLEALNGNIGNYIPAINVAVPVAAACELIKETRSLPAYVFPSEGWRETVLPLDKENGSWSTPQAAVDAWAKLYEDSGVLLPLVS
jgi:hypothetical protein